MLPIEHVECDPVGILAVKQECRYIADVVGHVQRVYRTILIWVAFGGNALAVK